MKNKIVSLVLLSLLILSCKDKKQNSENTVVTENGTFEKIDAQLFADKRFSYQNEGAQIIDVRTPEEFNSKHLDTAINIDYNNPNFEKNLKKLDKSKPTFVYCLSGGRSSAAASKMKELGFDEVYEMKGGMLQYNKLNKKVATNEISGLAMADYQKLTKSSKKVLVDFNAEWCGPCKRMAPYLEKMKEELKDEVVIISIDVDKNEALAQELKIESLPTLILYENQKSIWKNIGYLSEEELRAKLQ